MTDHHPLTTTILGLIGNQGAVTEDQIDEAIREYTTPPTLVAESGVRFPESPDTPVEVAGNFIQSGYQMQMALIGTEPVLLVQPEYDAEEGKVTLITTSVDLPPAGLVLVLEALLDGARTIVEVQAQQAAEMAEADAALRAANDEFEAQAREATEQ